MKKKSKKNILVYLSALLVALSLSQSKHKKSEIETDTKDKIYESVVSLNNKINKNVEIYKCNNLEEVVDRALKVAVKGEVVLFSPASASFDMFKNFADRGIKFKELVNNLK